jgi:hypothetical protein
LSNDLIHREIPWKIRGQTFELGENIMNLLMKKHFQQIPAITVLMGLLVATTRPVPAANLIWTGAVNDNWGDSSKNWLSNGVAVSSPLI